MFETISVLVSHATTAANSPKGPTLERLPLLAANYSELRFTGRPSLPWAHGVADGVLYNLAIRTAAKRLGLEVQLCRRRDEAGFAAAALGVSPEAVEEFVTGRWPSTRAAVDRGASSRLRRGDWRPRSARARPHDRVTGT